MLTLVAFIFALGLLIAVHEYGHYRMAVACGVKVLQFSIGFGRPLFRWRLKDSATEFLIAIFPVGGFVKMLDEREAPVAAADRHQAFNTQPLRARAAIVAAGPLANLLLAVLLYSLVNWSGVQLPAPILASPALGSIAERAGVTGGERVKLAGFDAGDLQKVDSFDDIRWFLTRGALQNQDVRLVASNTKQGLDTEFLLKLRHMDASEADASLFQKIGIVGPFSNPVIGEVVTGAAADKAGLQAGDVVRQVGAVPVVDGQQLRQIIRASVLKGEAVPAVWRIARARQELEITVKPEIYQEGQLLIGKIGAFVGAIPEMVMVRYGIVDSFWRGMGRTWDVSVLTLRMMGKMLLGEASLKNLSGPLTIADYAGKSAGMGLTQYLTFLAVISVSLGVLNLLPLPVLDGGHLMYYLWERIMGKPLPAAWMERLQRGGVAILMVMMAIALFNDLIRLFG